MMESTELSEEVEVPVEAGHDHDDVPGQLYFREMTAFVLLTPEEEARCSRVILENFQAIIDLVLQDSSGSREMATARAQICEWQEQDRVVRPRQSHLRAMVNAVFITSRLHPEIQAIQDLQQDVHRHRMRIDMSRDAMVHANLRLVVKIASAYRNMGLSLDDLVQEGNIGLMRAVMRYDYRVGTRLSSYAVWWIRQAIGNALVQKTRTIQVPFNVSLLAKRYSRAVGELRRALDREPTTAEVARHTRLTLEKIKTVAEIPAEPLSLEMPVSEDGELTLGHLLEDSRKTMFEHLAAAELRKQFHSCLHGLKERERSIIVARFGLEGEGEKTLKEIGASLKLSRERIRQLEQQALQRLKESGVVTAMVSECL